jgi:hypothetical protein
LPSEKNGTFGCFGETRARDDYRVRASVLI